MPIPADAVLSFHSGLISLLAALTFAALWRSQRRRYLLSFALSFAAIGTILVLEAVDVFLVPLHWREPVADAFFIAGSALLLAGCYQLTDRKVPWRWLAGVGAALYLAVQILAVLFGVLGVAYVPWLGGWLYLWIAFLFLSRRGQLGNRVLGLLFACRGALHLPWLWLESRPETTAVHAADQLLTLAIALALVVIELTRARLAVEVANARLREQAANLSALNAQFAVEREVAVDASRAKSAFLANMSHELRTPLNAVIGFSEMLADTAAGRYEARGREYARYIAEAGHHLLDIVNDVLEMSRLDARPGPLEPQPVRLSEVAAAARSMTAHQAESQGIRLTVEVEEAADRIEGDERYLKQILINLLSNAFKYSDPGDQVALRVVAAGDRIVMTVHDEGIGMTREELGRVFEPFAVGGASTTRARGGIGLGLSITKRLVELHGGSIAIDSAPGRGTRVRVELPRRSAGAASPAPARPADVGAAERPEGQ